MQRFRCLRATQVLHHDGLDFYCEDWNILPAAPRSAFCVVSTTNSGKDQRLLERDASLLIQATEAFAYDHLRMLGRDVGRQCLLLPVIVTNAPIYTARYRASDVSLDTGELTAPVDMATQPPAARFHKRFPSRSSMDLGERTIFVVNALSFSDFLVQLEISDTPRIDTARAHYQHRR